MSFSSEKVVDEKLCFCIQHKDQMGKLGLKLKNAKNIKDFHGSSMDYD